MKLQRRKIVTKKRLLNFFFKLNFRKKTCFELNVIIMSYDDHHQNNDVIMQTIMCSKCIYKKLFVYKN